MGMNSNDLMSLIHHLASTFTKECRISDANADYHMRKYMDGDFVGLVQNEDGTVADFDEKVRKMLRGVYDDTVAMLKERKLPTHKWYGRKKGKANKDVALHYLTQNCIVLGAVLVDPAVHQRFLLERDNTPIGRYAFNEAYDSAAMLMDKFREFLD